MDAREKIIETAMRLFSTQGYSTTSLSQVAKEAQVSKALIFWHFENKESLFRTAVQRTFEPYIINVVDDLEGLGEVEHRPRVQHRDVLHPGRLGVVEGELRLPVVLDRRAQLPLEVAQREVGQVVAALVGAHEVRREGGVAVHSQARRQRTAARQRRARTQPPAADVVGHGARDLQEHRRVGAGIERERELPGGHETGLSHFSNLVLSRVPIPGYP